MKTLAVPNAVETHISNIFFTADRAYKLLKPVKTGFLDHTVAAQRIWATEQELELNRRLAPDVYLGLSNLIEHGEVVDKLLIMRRLPAERRLSNLVNDAKFDDHLRAIARLVARFHAGLTPIVTRTALGSALGLRNFWESSCAEIAPWVDILIDREEFEEVRNLAASYLDHHASLFEARRDDGQIRDVHGDLTADDIFCLDDGPRILDCLAFNAEYRISDVLADIAFLVMDVERLAGRAAAQRLMRWYCEFTNEHHPASLAHHYVAYRAHVRAKVAVLQHGQGNLHAGELATAYHSQAIEHLLRARSTLLLLGGGPGTGKTTLANALGDRLNWSTIDSDTVRKDLRGIDHDDHAVHLHPDLYSDRATDATYAEMLQHTRILLEAGESVIVDATWAHRTFREVARRVADLSGAQCLEIECVIDPSIAKSRIRRRVLDGSDPSDATPELVDLLLQRDAWPEATTINTEMDINDAVDALIASTINHAAWA
jgi:aminoglycoside phosphotransferase family enzyme/predicted kinase